MASELKRESYVLCLAVKDARVPWYANIGLVLLDQTETLPRSEKN